MTFRFTTAALVLGSALSLALPAAAQASAKPPAAAPVPISSDPAAVRSGRYVLDPDHSKVTWSLSHLGFSTYVGQAVELSGTMTLDRMSPVATDLAVTVPMKELTSLNEELDDEIARPEWLDTARFPTATFKATRVEVTGTTTARILGDLTLKGVTKPIVIEATFNAAGTHPVDGKYTIGFDGRTTFRRSDFGVSALLPAVGDEVTLQIAAEFKAAE